MLIYPALSASPLDIPGPFIQVTAGDRHTCALTATRRLDCWGGNGDGQSLDQTGPLRQASAGWKHSCAITMAGAVDCWGSDQYGQGADQSGDYVQVSAGSGHNCAITATGAADCWGDNWVGRADDQPGPYGPYVPRASLTVKKVVVGAAPANNWAFVWTFGNFTLPAAGGERLFALVPGSNVTISETDRPGWAASVACTPGGETGIASVTLTVGEAVSATCIFTNTLCQPGTYDNGTICKAADPGFYVPGPGATQQLPCPPGTTSPGGASACVPVGTLGGRIFIPTITKQ